MHPRIAVLFDSVARPDTTGTYCLRAFQQLAVEGCIGLVDHFRPQDCEELEAGQYDLFVWIDDGNRYEIPNHLKPNVFWVIDTHMKPEWSIQQAAKFDYVFCAQRDGVDLIAKAGMELAEWLPLACDPEIHVCPPQEKSLDFSFIGFIGSPERAELLQLLKARYPNHLVGNRFFREMARTYASSRIVFNRSVKNDINMRVFEALASGSLLLTNDLAENGLGDLFEDGNHLATYRTTDELLAKIDWFLSHETARERIAQEGQNEVLEKHTYHHRMMRLLEIAKKCVLNRGLSTSVSANTSRSDDGVSSAKTNPLVSIVIVTFNQWEFTRQCLESLFKNTDISIQVVIVDNASTDETVNGLKQWPDLEVIVNDQNRGFPAAANQGIAASQGRFVLLLNNDVLVADKWLEPMLQAFQYDESIGIVGPCTNNTAGYQKIEVDYEIEEFPAFAADWYRKHGGTISLVDEVMGFCMFIDRRVINDIGPLDEEYGVGCYEDNDFCLRARHAGFQSAVANGSFVHHFGHVSFEAAGFDQGTLMVANRDRFMQKWHAFREEEMDDREVISEIDGRSVSEPSETPTVAASVRPEVANKDLSYFTHARPEILDLVPHSATRILDVGCGTGQLGLAIKNRQPARVTGIELNPLAAEQAANVLDQVISTDLENAAPELTDRYFDCVICADVLEHMRDPRSVLESICQWLSPDGVLITSIPNTRHHSVISSLLAGNWTYEPAGLLDADHVRFFTRREIEKLLHRAGFAISERKLTSGSDHSQWVQRGRPREIQIGPLQIRCQSQLDAEEFYSYQWLHVSKPIQKKDYGLTSIVIVTHNQWEYTRRCLESIRFVTDSPYELILVDNGSTDGTPEFLEQQPDVHLIRNSSNLGFPSAVNQGLKVSRGDNLLLLNNDVVVTTGWLERQLATLHSSDTIGLVGPSSNNVSGPQQVSVSYHQLEELDGFAWDWGQQHQGQKVSVERLVGFCLLFKRIVLNSIGELDERFGIGCFEDDDFCRRAIDAGYHCVIAKDAFIHHFGSVSFKGSAQDLGAILKANQKVYDRKWSNRLQLAEVGSDDQNERSETSVAPSPEPDTISEDLTTNLQEKVSLSACLIVRDNERTIRACLESLIPWMDEVVVVDTGSKDKTPEIAAGLGAHVFHWEWRDDFAAARNESLSRANGEWIFWMDSDDTLPESCGQQLRELALRKHDENTLGYVVQVHCPGGESQKEITVVDHVKLIRNHPEIRFEFRIHEQVIPSIRRLGGKVEWTDLYVIHSGSDQTLAGRERKRKRDFRLLELESKDRPDHPFVLFNLGMTYADTDNYPVAIDYLERCLKVTGPDESHLRKVYSLLSNAYSQIGQHGQALRISNVGREKFPQDKELLFRSAMLLHQTGQLVDAAMTYEQVLNESSERHFSSVDQGIAGYKTRHNLAIVYEQLGETAAAEQQWREVVNEQPEYRAAWRSLGKLIIESKDAAKLEWIEERFNATPSLVSELRLFEAKQLESAGKIVDAIERLDKAIEDEPDDIDLWNEVCRLSFSTESPQTTIKRLEKLRSLTPDDPSVLHNLGVKYVELGNWQQAEIRLAESLRLRPGHERTNRIYEEVLIERHANL